MRPRDVLKFVRHAVGVALNRGHDRVSAADLLQAERAYSEDMLAETSFEIADTHPELADALYAFEGSSPEMPGSEALDRLIQLLKLNEAEALSSLELLIWYGFLGVRRAAQDVPRYSYDVQGNLRRLMWALESSDAQVVIHPGFRAALGIFALRN